MWIFNWIQVKNVNPFWALVALMKGDNITAKADAEAPQKEFTVFLRMKTIKITMLATIRTMMKGLRVCLYAKPYSEIILTHKTTLTIITRCLKLLT